MQDLTRRGFLGLAGGAAAAAGLAACAGTGTPATDNGGGGTGGGSGTIDFWSNHPGTSKEVEQKIIAAFQAENPGLTVKLTDAGKNYEEVAQKFNAASPAARPDVVVASDVTWFNFALNKQLAPLDDLLSAAKVDTSDYVDALFNDYKFQDKHYALPYARSTPLFYYNKDIWKAAGLEDRGPKTWDELREWAPKIAAAAGSDKSVFEMPDGSNYLDWYFQNMAWDFGGQYSKDWTPTFSDAKTIQAGTFLQDLAKAGSVKFGKTPEADFGAGIVACIVQSTGSLKGITAAAEFNIGTAFLPGTDNCPTGGAGVAIPAKLSDDRKANALKFIAFLTNAQNTVTFTQATGYMPVRKSALDNPDEKAFLEKNPNSRTAVEQLPHTRSQDYARVFIPGGGARIGKALDQIAQGADVASTFQALDAETQQVYDSQIKPKL